MKLCQTVFLTSFRLEAIHEATHVLPLAGWSHKTWLHPASPRRKKLFCQMFFKIASASPKKLLHWRSCFTSYFKRSWSYAKWGLKLVTYVPLLCMIQLEVRTIDCLWEAGIFSFFIRNQSQVWSSVVAGSYRCKLVNFRCTSTSS